MLVLDSLRQIAHERFRLVAAVILLRAPHEGVAGEARLLHHPNAYIFYDVECDRSDSSRLHSAPVVSLASLCVVPIVLLTNPLTTVSHEI